MADVAIIVPTLRRPESLERALRSLFAQAGVGDRVSEIVVVDTPAALPVHSDIQALVMAQPAEPTTILERGARVRVRLINGATATAFWIDLDQLEGRLIAVDGTPVAKRPVDPDVAWVVQGDRGITTAAAP